MAVGKQLELASIRGATHAVVIGPDERAKQEVVVRELKTKSERRVAMHAIADAFSTHVREKP
jgi:histidyl-tRNA synthetase